jgi:hypothetical protein
MRLLNTFKKKNGNNGQLSHIAHLIISVNSQVRQQTNDSISADKRLIHKHKDLIAVQLNESILNRIKFRHK